MDDKKYKRLKRTLVAFLVILIVLAILLSVVMAFCYTVEFTARFVPAYAKTDLSPLLAKAEWTDEDYRELYHQTGLGKTALDELKDEPETLLEFQEAFFSDPEIAHEMAASTTPHDVVLKTVYPLVALRDGDVIVSSACHTFGWRNGHAALVVNGAVGRTLESMAPGTLSVNGTVGWFQTSSNFMVLRLKEEYRETANPARIAADAQKKLKDVRYSIFVGFLYSKDQCANGRQMSVTHCSHLVWQAYMNFGLDIDSNGGPLVTAQDIANSPYFDVIQVNGFDPDLLWN